MTAALPAVHHHAVGQLKARLQARFGERLRHFVLFGSRAWGEPRPDSDVDLCIVIDDLTRREHLDVFEIAADVAAETFIDLAPLVYSTERFRRCLELEYALPEDIVERGVPL